MYHRNPSQFWNAEPGVHERVGKATGSTALSPCQVNITAAVFCASPVVWSWSVQSMTARAAVHRQLLHTTTTVPMLMMTANRRTPVWARRRCAMRTSSVPQVKPRCWISLVLVNPHLFTHSFPYNTEMLIKGQVASVADTRLLEMKLNKAESLIRDQAEAIAKYSERNIKLTTMLEQHQKLLVSIEFDIKANQTMCNCIKESLNAFNERVLTGTCIGVLIGHGKTIQTTAWLLSLKLCLSPWQLTKMWRLA